MRNSFIRSLLIYQNASQKCYSVPNLVVILFLPVTSGPSDAVAETLGPLIHEGHFQRLNGLQRLHTRQSLGSFYELRIAQVLLCIFRRLLEKSLKIVPSPLQGVLNRVREIFQSTNRNTLFWGILRRTVGFCHKWYYNLEEQVY